MAALVAQPSLRTGVQSSSLLNLAESGTCRYGDNGADRYGLWLWLTDDVPPRESPKSGPPVA
jgi:hypothetical protein